VPEIVDMEADITSIHFVAFAHYGIFNFLFVKTLLRESSAVLRSKIN
jgi:hypothetical protein